jgi:hypothetical protein
MRTQMILAATTAAIALILGSAGAATITGCLNGPNAGQSGKENRPNKKVRFSGLRDWPPLFLIV